MTTRTILKAIAVVVVVLLVVAAIVLYQVRHRMRVRALADAWSRSQLAIGLVNCPNVYGLYLGVPCNEIVEAYDLQWSEHGAH